MAQFMENIGALIEYNGNPITLPDQGVKCINCKCGWRSDQGRSVNEGLWLAFVKTQWSSYVLKVRPPLWHKKMKTFYFLGNVMIWIKIVRLAVSSYHGADVLYDLFKELSFSAPVMPPRPLFPWRVMSTGCYLPHRTIAQIAVYLQTSRLRLLRMQLFRFYSTLWMKPLLCAAAAAAAGLNVTHSQLCVVSALEQPLI